MKIKNNQWNENYECKAQRLMNEISIHIEKLSFFHMNQEENQLLKVIEKKFETINNWNIHEEMYRKRVTGSTEAWH